MGKGSKRRPSLVRDDEVEQNWNAIFKREKQNTEKSRYRKTKDNK